MTTFKIEIEQENDVSLLKRVLTELGFNFVLEDDKANSITVSEHELAGINAGLKDVQEGRVFRSEYVKTRIDDKIAQLRLKYGNQ
ncbi:hypothetical protein [Dyadobacter sp. CY326]|uniref:hypothetical protein n=1 Tax=Dyadobacter sp. CY326 TaxID=2907300 RepID=UPI001F32B116|nr:hypothetical protein [Dyadobacter sp. CY326]MCE7066379.1 hypothetical protein [Dyadobacter sp. CY326]